MPKPSKAYAYRNRQPGKICPICGKPIALGAPKTWQRTAGGGMNFHLEEFRERHPEIEIDYKYFDKDEPVMDSVKSEPSTEELYEELKGFLADDEAREQIVQPTPPFAELSWDRPWEIAELAVRTGKHVALWGPPGTGKTYLAQGKGGAYSLTCHEQMQPSEAFGHVWPSGAAWQWKDGPITLAFRNGRKLVLNELGRCNPEIHDALLGVLDSPESALITLETGEVLKPAKGFVAIATSNTDPAETLDIAFQHRLISIHVTEPHPKLIARIAKGSPQLAEMVARSYKSGQDLLSTRAALNFLDLKDTFGPEIAATLVFGPRGRDVWQMLNVPTTTEGEKK
jgi:hypothetical protein